MEAEYVALSEAIKKVIFVNQLLGRLMISVKYPVTVRVDNIDAIFMSSNITTVSCTKQMDISYKYGNECVDERFVNIVFVMSADNNCNILTKNLS